MRPIIESRLATGLAGVAVRVDDQPSITWHDGPGETTLAATIGDLSGWQLRVVLDHGETQGGDGERRRIIRLRRSFSDAALAVAVVRYQASTIRPYDSARPGAESALRDLLDVDDPAVSGYPIVDAMAGLLFTAPDPEPDEPVGGSRADLWSRKLTSVGYDALWNQAYANATL